MGLCRLELRDHSLLKKKSTNIRITVHNSMHVNNNSPLSIKNSKFIIKPKQKSIHFQNQNIIKIILKFLKRGKHH